MASVRPVLVQNSRTFPESRTPGGDVRPPFWPRLARAVALLAAAVFAHVWLPSTQLAKPEGLRPDAPIVAGAATPMRDTSAGTVRLAASGIDNVRVEHQLVRTLPAFGSAGRAATLARGTNVPEEPTGTAGDGPILADATIDFGPSIEIASLPRPDEDARRPVAESAAVVMRPARSEDVAPIETETSRAAAALQDDGVETNVLSAMSNAARSSVVAAAEPVDEEQVVLDILREYRRAFERLDVRAAKAVWPSLDDRALNRAFQQLDSQQLRFASCGVSITGRDANARCHGDATYRPKVGSRVVHLPARQWTFDLSRSASGWQIVNARIQ